MFGKALRAPALAAVLVFAAVAPVYAEGDPGSWQPQKTELSD